MTQNDKVTTRVRASFEKQKIMRLLGATLTGVEPGQIEITLPFREELTQQHGFLHAGVVTTILDSACGYAALSVMPEGAGVLSIESKVNLLTRQKETRSLRGDGSCEPGGQSWYVAATL